MPCPVALQVRLDDPLESVKEKEERRRLQDYYANVGDAIRTLRDEIPRLFAQDLTCAFSIHFATPLPILLGA